MAKQKVNKATLIAGTARNVNTNNIFTKGKKVQANKNIIAQKRTTHPPSRFKWNKKAFSHRNDLQSDESNRFTATAWKEPNTNTITVHVTATPTPLHTQSKIIEATLHIHALSFSTSLKKSPEIIIF